jgi:hypothetical protein
MLPMRNTIRLIVAALAAAFFAGGIGAQSFAPLPAYAAPMMIAPDSRAGWAEVPPLLPRDVILNAKCYDNGKMDMTVSPDSGDRVPAICEMASWRVLPGGPIGEIPGVDQVGQPCPLEPGPWMGYTLSKTPDGHLLNCYPGRNWSIGFPNLATD